MTPQIIFLALTFISLLLNANSHGKMDKRPNNFWRVLLSFIIIQSLLYWGGFYNCFFK